MKSSLNSAFLLAILAVLPTPQLALSIPFSFGYCINTPYVGNLDPDSFFNGTWYQQKSYGEFLLGEGGICPTKKFQRSSDGVITELFYDFEALFQSWVSMTGRSPAGSVSNGVGVYDITYTLGSLPSYTTPVTIVATDYDNYALAYSCKQALLLKTEMAWVMTRQRNTSDSTTDINTVITKAGLDLTKFKDSDNTNCPPNEPEL